MHTIILTFLFLFSGFAALVYQILWVRELGLLFGSTAQGAAITISIFFIGLATGSWFWGSVSRKVRKPLFYFGLLETGVAASACGFFLLSDAYHTLYPYWYEQYGTLPFFNTALKLFISTSILFVPSFLMGGTFPLITEHFVKHHHELARKGSFLYFINTSGSLLGVIAAGFYLPIHYGFTTTYLIAVSADLFVGVTAMLLGSKRNSTVTHHTLKDTKSRSTIKSETSIKFLSFNVLLSIAVFSGFISIAVEILWTRMFSQVLQNSTYTYSLVLGIFLLALAMGAVLANILTRFRIASPYLILVILLSVSGILVSISPLFFFSSTNSMSYLGGTASWEAYMRSVLSIAALVMLPPGIIFGAILPFLLRLVKENNDRSGSIIGRLVSLNTLGSVAGSVSAGFILLPALGVWKSILLMGVLYSVLSLSIVLYEPLIKTRILVLVSSVSFLATLMLFIFHKQPHKIGVRSSDGKIVEVIEGAHATTAVVEGRGGNRSILVNTNYTLGSSFAKIAERDQAMIPLLLHPDPKSVFFLGMGTGITAGASLHFPLERVMVCELLPEVVTVSEKHFSKWTNGLFSDVRAEVIAEDGRNCLRRSRETFDLIISDLFTPWKAGTGNLYTKDHYQTSLRRLSEHGLYVQWIPLYQVSEKELGSIAQTMDQVFPRVTLWRGDFFSERSVVALIGHANESPLDISDISRHSSLFKKFSYDISPQIISAMLLRLYGGNVTDSKLYSEYPLNSDNNPYIEFTAPRTHRNVQSGKDNFLLGSFREFMYERFRTAVPFDLDPYLALLGKEELLYISGGHEYSQYKTLRDTHLKEHAPEFLERAASMMPDGFDPELTPASIIGKKKGS
jgi:spermidine synthase